MKVIVTLQRNKCIGCGYCVEASSEQFQISKKNGKAVLLNSTYRNGFFTYKTTNDRIYDSCKQAEKSCPVKIINVKLN